MQQCEGVLLGREPVDGTVNASCLATLVRTLLASRDRLCRSVGTSSVYGERRRYTLRCRDGLEILPSHHKTSSSSSSSSRPRRLDDEGFESDDDTSSTKSAASIDDTISTSSSCCFVDDHVFKFPTNTNTSSSRVATNSTSSTSSVATDSANSSGASDTDDVDTSASPSPSTNIGTVSKLVQSLTLFQSRNTLTNPSINKESADAKASESYSVSDIAFCHTDPAFPKVIVWVVKKRRLQRLTTTGSDNGGGGLGLEAIVFECLNERGLKKIYSSYQEISRRAKLDQYRHPHRRKDGYPSNDTSTPSPTPPSYPLSPLYSNSNGPQKTTVMTYSTTNQPSDIHQATNIPKTYGQQTSPKTLPKPRPVSQASNVDGIPANKFNLVQRTDGDGVTHIEVARGVVQSSIPVETITDPGAASSIISISTPDVGNMLSSNGAQKSKLCKEIEGVIRSDIDTSGVRREPTTRQREPAILVINGGAGGGEAGDELHKVWSPPKVDLDTAGGDDELDEDQLDVIVNEPVQPPQRPERRKYMKKKPPPPPPPISARPSPEMMAVENSKRLHIPSRSEVYLKNQQNSQQKIVRGQYIRVNVDQPQQQQQPAVIPLSRSGSPWILSNSTGSSKMVAYSSPSWVPLSPPLKSTTKEAAPKRSGHRRVLDDLFTLHSTGQKQHRRSRSSGGGTTGRNRSPPATRRPMAYRYIDVGNPPTMPSSLTNTSNSNTLSNRFFGLSQKLRDIGGGSSGGGYPYATTGRRRLDEDDGHLSSSDSKGNLKSVIKKGKRAGEYVEPKKVTFSAYATVQVVD